MSGVDDTDEWWTTDHRLIREWARARGAEPVMIDRADDPDLALQTDPAAEPGERILWPEFFERFEERSQALLHRSPGAAEGSRSQRDWQVIDRDAVPAHAEAAAKTEPPATLDSDQLALSDTGEGEPVAFDRTEDGSELTDEQASTAETKDRARGSTAAEDALVLDSIRERPVGSGEWRETDEAVTFENSSAVSLDLGGWIVHNDAGQSYRLPEGVTLDPGATLTVHGGDGIDTETDLYWDADEPVWPNQGGTVVVETPANERVVDVSYKGGR